MTSPRNTEADGSGPAVVVDTAGPFCAALPYDPESVFRDDPLPRGMRVTLPRGSFYGGQHSADYHFTTLEAGRYVNNCLTFAVAEGQTVVVTGADIRAAICGDIDTVEFSANATSRNMRVTYPRPNIPEAVHRLTLEQRWAAHLATAAEIMRRYERQRAEAQRRYAEQMAAEDRAREKSTEMLLRMLDNTQRASQRKNHYFDLVGSAGTHYRIWTTSYSGNVYYMKAVPDRRFKTGVRLEEGGRFCGHCDNDYRQQWIPTHDHNLVQMLELRYDEIAWLNTAIRQTKDYPPAWYRALPRRKAEKMAYEEKYYRDRGSAVPVTGSCTCNECLG